MATKRKKNYLNNADMLEEIRKSKQRMIDNPELVPGEAMTRKLAEMFLLLVKRFAQKSNWSGYSYVEELQQEALLNLVNKWHKFDSDQFDKPFAYFSTLVDRSFMGQLAKEKKPQKVKDAMLADMGALPSFRAQEEELDKQIQSMKEDADTQEIYNISDIKNDDPESV